MKKIIALTFVLVLTHCASAPKPPHCDDNGKGMKPVNHAPVTLKPMDQHHE